MRNIILFIRRFFTFFMFLVLQGISWAILVKYSKSHQAVFAEAANEVTGKVSKQYNTVEYYFELKKTNEQLVAEIKRLYDERRSSFEGADSSTQVKLDSMLRDSTHKGFRRFTYLPAKVVNNSVTNENNYITLYRGRLQGVHPDMAVVGPDGIVGRVILASDNYSRVMSLLNHKSNVNAMLKKGYVSGIVEWDGKDPSYVTLRNIPKSADVKRGDTVLTSNISEQLSYPPGIMVGTVTNVAADNAASNFFTIRVKTSTNFYSLQYAYVVQDASWAEQKKLEAQTPKN
ncbi:rod shape-determining protein MreC [Foetidibacter luteolus]|uniref:rod shape-determining protein MreC n=1 Tax=Foetidibacter luteolus TaxID=2608880 RepID=UPI00129A69B3|nr:rod shape-determining protein MreC [Foetidibacter luteolus]